MSQWRRPGSLRKECSLRIVFEPVGLRFQEHERRGIKVEDFGALLMESGLVLCEDVHWISFSSFYYFGYLLKTLTCSELPKSQDVSWQLHFDETARGLRLRSQISNPFTWFLI
mmetsp:Transcript_18427/g.73948  ORF Transcript_18427/g.73948 Transcript_18427/m.73948 type:complete len:113 (+) Transcript_18427:826-1164(+)